jgi:hypothetical protein
MSTETLYHSEIRLPTGFVAPTQRVELSWTRHADSERTKDRYAEIPKYKGLSLKRFAVIEVGMTGNTVSKIVFRGRMDDTNDVVIVLIPNGARPWTVKTVWCNKRTDIHTTLDKSKYMH